MRKFFWASTAVLLALSTAHAGNLDPLKKLSVPELQEIFAHGSPSGCAVTLSTIPQKDSPVIRIEVKNTKTGKARFLEYKESADWQEYQEFHGANYPKPDWVSSNGYVRPFEKVGMISLDIATSHKSLASMKIFVDAQKRIVGAAFREQKTGFMYSETTDFFTCGNSGTLSDPDALPESAGATNRRKDLPEIPMQPAPAPATAPAGTALPK